jgi:hypothetical protein
VSASRGSRQEPPAADERVPGPDRLPAPSSPRVAETPPLPVPEDPETAAALQALAIEPEIPAALYRALVTTLDWASELDVRLRAH